MSLNNSINNSRKVILYPVALVAWLYIKTRNWLYNKKILRSTGFNFPIICVGNLSLGGTGKSPMVEYLINLLQPTYNVSTLSRGYKRKTKGYLLANEQTTALEIGDEPMQFHLKFPKVNVAVGEERIVAVPQLLHDKPETDVIILDDAFQHRPIKAGLNILLTPFDKPYWSDSYIPAGDLRDNKSSAQRAEIIIVTKCPADLKEEVRKKYLKQINATKEQNVFFTGIEYGAAYDLITKEQLPLNKNLDVLLVCGIANPRPLRQFLDATVKSYREITFSDHHIFTIDDWRKIEKEYNDIKSNNKIILTTEKDAVRLVKFGEFLNEIPIYALPIQPAFLFNQQQEFNHLITSFIGTFDRVNNQIP
ncbi:tetraacyldisaccharide 4'-kinase [Polluticaenibacter yanchengensis]|uniref:Tetraacyldisaccharide 4'-kinase n=1 Tax=Polluticaenibacter yanchengensis TaxID=3014562 RepID=A0ABT4UMN9_9BACT|nr:tetraacyldisaccharide 4'-kinase [Chitinophagaceae bacterium LY-5]